MKKLVCFVLVAGFAVQGFGDDESLEGSLSCLSRENNTFGRVSVTAKLIALPEANKGAMWDVVAQVTEANSDETETGRRKSLDTNPKYKPTKYLDHSQFKLSGLVDTKTFGDFLPVDSCELGLLFPNQIFAKAPTDKSKKVKFKAPLTVQCDQSGTSLTLNCEVTPR